MSSSKVCPSCQKNNNPTFTVCWKCGYSFVTGEQIKPLGKEGKNNLPLIGFLIALIGGLLNGVLIRNEIGGLVRELMRLVILSGLIVLVYGLIRGKKMPQQVEPREAGKSVSNAPVQNDIVHPMRKQSLGFFFIYLPFFIFLIILGYFEINTGLIRDPALLGAIAYFFFAVLFAGTKRWWTYLLGAFSTFVLTYAAAILFGAYYAKESLGGGTIKLMFVVGLVLGVKRGMIAVLYTVLLLVVGGFLINRIFHLEVMASIPMILPAIVLTLLTTEVFFKRKIKIEVFDARHSSGS